MGVWGSLIAAVVRWALLILLAPLVTRGIVPQNVADSVLNEGTMQIVAALASLAVLAWSCRDKIVDWIGIKKALHAPASTPVEQIKSEVAAMPMTEKVSVAFTDKQ